MSGPATRADLDLLRMLAAHLGGPLAAAFCSEAGIRSAVAGRWGGAFGQGATWGRYVYEAAGVEVYRQVDGSTVLLPWSALRALRAAAPRAALDALGEALAACGAGPAWRLHVLPPELHPEGHDPAMTPEALRAAQDEHFGWWQREVVIPRWRYGEAAHVALVRAWDAVLNLDGGPLDLLDLLAAQDRVCSRGSRRAEQ